MSQTVTAVFDGKVFVPDGPIDLPAGTPARLVIGATPADPPVPTTGGDETGEPFRTLDEYMAYSRGRPWPYPLIPFEPPPPGFEHYVPPEGGYVPPSEGGP